MNTQELSKIIQGGDNSYSSLHRKVEQIVDELKDKRKISKEDLQKFNSSVDTLVTWLNLVLLPSIKVQAGGGDNVTYNTDMVYIGYNFGTLLMTYWGKDYDRYNLKPVLTKYRAFLLRLKSNARKYYNMQQIKQVKKQLA